MDGRLQEQSVQQRMEIFCCYARKDQEMLLALKAYLAPLMREGLVTLWADTDIKAGAEWEKEIHLHLHKAQIILLLVSPDFIASEYCYSIEMKQAMIRHKHGEVYVIPIILRRVSWQNTPLGKLQALPENAEPITSVKWPHQDDAFYSVVNGLRDRIKAHQAEQERDNITSSAVQVLATQEENTRFPVVLSQFDASIYVLEKKREQQIAQKHILMSNDILSQLQMLKVEAGFYVYPDIPEKKIRAVVRLCKIPRNESILAIIEFPFRHASGRSCIVFGSDNIYARWENSRFLGPSYPL